MNSEPSLAATSAAGWGSFLGGILLLAYSIFALLVSGFIGFAGGRWAFAKSVGFFAGMPLLLWAFLKIDNELEHRKYTSALKNIQQLCGQARDVIRTSQPIKGVSQLRVRLDRDLKMSGGNRMTPEFPLVLGELSAAISSRPGEQSGFQVINFSPSAQVSVASSSPAVRYEIVIKEISHAAPKDEGKWPISETTINIVDTSNSAVLATKQDYRSSILGCGGSGRPEHLRKFVGSVLELQESRSLL